MIRREISDRLPTFWRGFSSAILVQLSVSQFSYKVLGISFLLFLPCLLRTTVLSLSIALAPPFPLRQEFHNAAPGWS